MNRGYSVKDYLNIYNSLKKNIPGIQIRSDFLIGFPSETKDDFKKTYDLIKELDFYHIQIFSYTEMDCTTASKFKGKIPINVRNRRVKDIIKMFLEKNKGIARPLVQTNIKY